MDRIKRNGAAGLALRAVVLGICVLGGCMRSTVSLAMIGADHAGYVSIVG